MAVGHEDISVGRNRHSCWLIECVWPDPADAWCADRHQHLAGRTDLENLLAHRDTLSVLRRDAEDRFLVISVGCPDVPVLVDSESVRVRKESDAEALQKPARRVELQDRWVGFASIE